MRRYVVADVFTDRPLQGNPVAVFEDAQGLDGDLMQRAARELNLSETVFVLPATDADHDAHIRIFTPALELPFAGHPVLGTAFVVGESLGLEVVRLRCARGLVPVALQRGDGAIVYGEMEQPVPAWSAYDRADEVLAAVGVTRSELPVEVYDNGPRHAYVCLPDAAAVATLTPDIGALARLGAGVGVSCFAADGARVKTRMFGPGLGVAEDPATGSAAGPLAVHLARHGVVGFGERIEILQGAEIGRPSTLYAQADGSAERIDRVLVGGCAVMVARGEYRLD
ncbi:MAG TPA: PhzF family phenazine biosynthesis isomerase [Solirubrobacteraceae bacterium]|nr:PhzF family phenazine biosynthesis isomerase [Solirubrobacteraceae bacterium]